MLADEVRAPEDHDVLSTRIVARAQEKFLAPARRAGNERCLAVQKFTHIERMKSVHVFVRRNRVEDFSLIDLVRQRKLNKNGVHFRVGVELNNQIEKTPFRAGLRQVVGKGPDAQLGAGAFLHADVDLACGVVPDQDDGDSGNNLTARERFDFLGDLRTDLRGDLRAVDEFCHAIFPPGPRKGQMIAESVGPVKDSLRRGGELDILRYAIEIAGVRRPC